MPRNYSTAFKETINRTAASEAPLVLLEIDHADLPAPIRVVNDNQDLTHIGNVFTAMAFRVTLPDDLEEGMPRARLAVDNIGRELTAWLDASAGGQGATCRIIQVLRSDPDTIEFDLTMDLGDVTMDMIEVAGTLSFEDTLNRPGVTMTYRPTVAPGLF